MKRISGVLAGIMLFVFVFSNSAFAAGFTDVGENTQYRSAITMLTTLGLIKGYEDGTFGPDKSITRAEFTTIAIRALNADKIQVGGIEEIFSDVQSDHYAKYAIRTAYDRGIINGMGDGTFQPDSTVTYEQAVKMVVCMIGYGNTALRNGGWPDGYMVTAANIGLTKDITAARTEPAKRGVIAQLIYNALEVPLQEQAIGDPTKEVITDKTLLKDVLEIEEEKVLVTGVGDSYLSNEAKGLNKGELAVAVVGTDEQMKLDYTQVMKSELEALQYLGYVLKIYYKDNGGSELPTLVAMDNTTEKNNVISITAKKISKYQDAYVTYENDAGKEQRIKINMDSMNVVYNGKMVNHNSTVTIGDWSVTLTEAVAAWLTPEDDHFINGEIRIIDQNADNTADVLFITNYQTIMANSTPTTVDYRITDKLKAGNSLILNPNDDNEYTFTITKAGNEIKTTDIKANDIVLYAVSLDRDLYTVSVNSTPVTGAITSVEEDNGDQIVEINGKKYDVADSCIENLDSTTQIKVGISGTFYPDKYNNIVYCTLTKGETGKYAYIVSAVQSNETDDVSAQVYAPGYSTSVQKMSFASKVKNGDGASFTDEQMLNNLKATAQSSRADIDNKEEVYGRNADKVNTTATSQLVKINASNKNINKIVTLSTEEGGNNESDDSLVRYKSLSKLKYSGSNNFSNEFYIDSKTTILYIPGDRTAKEDYQKYTLSTFKTNESYWVEAYDVDTSKHAALVLVYGNDAQAEVSKQSPIWIAKKGASKVSSDDDNVNKLFLYEGGSIKDTTKTTDNNTEFADVQAGDVIQFGTKKNKAINRQNLLLNAHVEEVLDSGVYDWTGSQFDNSFVDPDTGEIAKNAEGEIYTRVFVANVLEVGMDEENPFIRVSKQDIGDGRGEGLEEEYFDLKKSKPVILKNVKKGKSWEVSPYIGDTKQTYSITDLKDAKGSGNLCDKVMVYVSEGQVNTIMFYGQE
jgi:hypothetical protein